MKEKEAGENTYRQFHVILITLHQNRQTSKRTTNAKKNGNNGYNEHFADCILGQHISLRRKCLAP